MSNEQGGTARAPLKRRIGNACSSRNVHRIYLPSCFLTFDNSRKLVLYSPDPSLTNRAIPRKKRLRVAHLILMCLVQYSPHHHGSAIDIDVFLPNLSALLQTRRYHFPALWLLSPGFNRGAWPKTVVDTLACSFSALARGDGYPMALVEVTCKDDLSHHLCCLPLTQMILFPVVFRRLKPEVVEPSMVWSFTRGYRYIIHDLRA